MKKLFSLTALLAVFAVFPLIAQDAEFYFNRGMEYGSSGDFDRAIADLTEAIRLKPDYVDAYVYRGSAYGIREQWDQWIDDWNEALRLAPDFPDIKGGLAQAYGYRGLAYNGKGELDRAIADFTRAIALDPNLAEPWNNRGNAYQGKGELDRAIEDYSRTIALDPDLAEPWSNRGSVYAAKGELDRAIEDYTRAIILSPNAFLPWNNRGIAYTAKGELDLAIEDYTMAISLNPNDPKPWNNRGLAYGYKEEPYKAIEDFTRAIALDKNFTNAWNNRGLVYYACGEFDRAIEDYTMAITLDKNNANAWINRGYVYTKKGELDLAKADYRQSIETADRSGNMLDIFLLSWHFAGFLYENYPFLDGGMHENAADAQRTGLAREAFGRSIARAEKARSTLGARGAQIMTGQLFQYYAAVDFEAVVGSAETAFSYSEALRSRGFLEQMGTEAALKLQGISDAEAQNVRRLIRDIDNLRDLLSRLNPQTDGGKYAEAGIALSRAEAELATLDAAIAKKVPRYAELRNPKTATPAQAKSFCGSDTAILEYVIWDSDEESKRQFKAPSSPDGGLSSFPDWPAINSYCLVITKDGITAVRLEPGFDYTQTVNRLRTNITRKNRIGTMESDRNALYNALIKPALPHIPKTIKNIIIVPDGTLGHLPFDILREDSDSPDLGETYRLSLSPSVSVSMLSEKTSKLNLPILAFGGAWYDKEKTAAERGAQRSVSYGDETKEIYWRDLPGTEAEVKKLKQLVSSAKNIRVLQGSDVSEKQVKMLSAEGELAIYPMLHFATHGYFKEEDLERAGIVLSEVSGLLDNGEDGYLTIPEIAVLDLNARMVLLSACETGKGVLRRGDGMVGMVRAFLLAGAEYMGVSLWEIDDAATLEFMGNLYKKVLNKKLPFTEAYYQVKKEFRKHKKWNHPYYWSAFIIYE